MNTQDWIRLLSKNIEPVSTRRFYRNLFVGAALGTAVLLTLAYMIFPARYDLAERLSNFRFTAETLLCLAAFFTGSAVGYLSALPGRLERRHQIIGLGIFALLLTSLLTKSPIHPLQGEFRIEMDWFRGRCGPLIFIIGLLEGSLFLALARRCAPTRPAITAAWIAAGGGSLGLFIMQFVCPYENFLHLLIWHFFPIFLLAGLGYGAGRRVLRW